MKKPVRAIDMRRTATVLDFAVAIVSTLSRNTEKRSPYLSSPSCDLEWTMRLQAPDSGDSRVNVRLRRCGGEFPLWDVGRHLLLHNQISFLPHSTMSRVRCCYSAGSLRKRIREMATKTSHTVQFLTGHLSTILLIGMADSMEPDILQQSFVLVLCAADHKR
jgi:hypothetical protein